MMRLLLLALRLPAAACGNVRKADLVTRRMLQLSPEGGYEYRDGNAAAVTPGPSGTQEGADAINACVLGKRVAADVPQPVPQGPTRGGIPECTVVRRGAGNTTAQTYTGGTPPSDATTPLENAAQPSARQFRASAGCPPGVSGMYRGTLICCG
ncbi:hypothetical protein ATI53_100363 [Salipiger aestuarii]|uniref:Uncharacterized protein n=1 Tax=Salipiger aestuarii TaxID=568098 RepID=A0A327YNT5_9RHOB|nr:hypothetical protein ATI53_100363 [Salipiger aestuarii]